MGTLDDLKGKSIRVNGVNYPDRKILDITSIGAGVSDDSINDATSINFDGSFSGGARVVDFRSYGATGGDSVADTAAWKALCLEINTAATNAGGDSTTPGLVGIEVRFPDTGSAYVFDFTSETFGSDIQIHNAKGVRFIGNGTRIKVADGSRVGDVTFTNDNAYTFYFQNCADVVVRGFELDGNLANLSIGSVDGRGIGVALYKVHDALIEDCYIHDYGTDAILLWSRVANENNRCERVTLKNVRTSQSRRQGMSIVAGTHTTCVNCAFNDTGQGAASIAPRAGVDLEPSFSTDIVEHTTFIGCQFLNNVSSGFINDSNVERVKHTTFIGCDVEKLWAKSPTTVFIGGTVTGNFLNYYGKIYGAYLDLNDTSIGYSFSNNNASAGLYMDNCYVRMDCTGDVGGMHLEGTGGKTIVNSTLEFANTDQLTATAVALVRNSETRLENITITDSGTTKGVYISITDALLRECRSDSSTIAFEGVSGRLYLDDKNGFIDDSSTAATFQPSARKQNMSGATRSVTAYNAPAGNKVWVRANGTTITFVDNANFTPLVAGNLVLTTGQEALLYFPTGSTCQQLDPWEY